MRKGSGAYDRTEPSGRSSQSGKSQAESPGLRMGSVAPDPSRRITIDSRSLKARVPLDPSTKHRRAPPTHGAYTCRALGDRRQLLPPAPRF